MSEGVKYPLLKNAVDYMSDEIKGEAWAPLHAEYQQAERTAVELEAAQNRIAELEAILQKTLLALNTCRIIMDSKEARDMAGDIVKCGRQALGGQS